MIPAQLFSLDTTKGAVGKFPARQSVVDHPHDESVAWLA
jgi:hypothetical protein